MSERVCFYKWALCVAKIKMKLTINFSLPGYVLSSLSSESMILMKITLDHGILLKSTCRGELGLDLSLNSILLHIIPEIWFVEEDHSNCKSLWALQG